MHTFKKALLPLMATVAIVGCSNDNKSIEDVIGAAGTVDTSTAALPVAKFAPSAGVLPFPSDILFSGTLDGSLNIPDVANTGSRLAPTAAEIAAAGADGPKVAMNTLAGFSTTSPIVFEVTASIDLANVNNGVGLQVIEVNTATPFSSIKCLFQAATMDPAACGGFDASSKTVFSMAGSRTLVYGVDYVTSVTDSGVSSSVAIVPLRPLSPKATYMVMVTNDITVANSTTKIRTDLEYQIAKGPATVFYLSRDIAEDLKSLTVENTVEAAMAFLAAAMNATNADVQALGLPDAAVQAVLTAVLHPTDSSISCLTAKGLSDAIDAASPVINMNPLTDCTSTVAALSDPATAFSFEGLRFQTSAHEAALASFGATSSVDNMVLTFSFTTQDVGTALLQAKKVAATAIAGGLFTAPASGEMAGGSAVIEMNLPVGAIQSPGIPVGAIPSQSYANIGLGTLKNAPQFLDKANPTTAFWKGESTAWAVRESFGYDAGNPGSVASLTAIGIAAACTGALGTTASENLVDCNGYIPGLLAGAAGLVDIPVFVSVPNLTTVNATRALLNGGGADDCPATLQMTIYQHGITTNRMTALAIADSLALQCQVVVAIDMAQHGINSDAVLDALVAEGLLAESSATSLKGARAAYAGAGGATERVVAAGTANEVVSGAAFINPANLANSRDTFRQSVVDLHSLLTAIAPKVAADPALTSTLNLGTNKLGVGIAVNEAVTVNFVGMSLGGIVGMPFVAQQQGIGTVVLNVTGGGIAKLLDGSTKFGLPLHAGLAAAGIPRPSASFESFMLATQTMVDSADPINMVRQIQFPNSTATTPGVTKRAILLQEVAGNATNAADQSVPNNVFGSPLDATGAGGAFAAVYAKGGTLSPSAGYNPADTVPGLLSGTDPLARGTAFISVAQAVAAGLLPAATATPLGVSGLDPDADGLVDAAFGALKGGFLGMNLAQIDEAGTAGATILNALVRYSEGEHGSLLSPASSANVTTAMQLQMAGFIAAGGLAVPGLTSGVPAGVINAP